MTRTRRLDSMLPVVALASVVVASAIQVVTRFFPDMSRLVAIIITVIGVVVAMTTGVLQFVLERRRSRQSRAPEAEGAPVPLPARRRQVSTFWMGSTLILVLLTMASSLFAPFAILTGLLAFQQRRLAAGVGAVLGGVVALFVVALMSSEPPATPPNSPRDASDIAVLNTYFRSLQQRCSQGWYVPDPYACGLAYGGPQQQEELLRRYQYDEAYAELRCQDR